MRVRIPVGYTPSAMNLRPNSFRFRCAIVYAIASVFFCSSLFAQNQNANSRAAAVLDSLPHAKRIAEVALSPDGSQVVYIVDEEIAVAPAAGGSSHAITVEGNLLLRDVAWSGDSKRIAFIADLPGDVPSAQLWTAAADGSALAKHADLK